MKIWIEFIQLVSRWNYVYLEIYKWKKWYEKQLNFERRIKGNKNLKSKNELENENNSSSEEEENEISREEL